MGDIRLQTEIPGPRSRALQKARDSAVAQGLATTIPVFVERSAGAVVIDVDGNHLIDLAGGIGSLNVGHTPKPVVAALQEQLEHYISPVFHVTMYEPYIRLCEKLGEITPGTFAKKTALFNSGAEAVENAVKIARRYTGRPGIIAFNHAFHGRTLLTMSLTGKVASFKRGFGPLATDIYRLPYPYPFRDGRGTEELLQQFEQLFQYQVAAEDVAAVIMEPIQGDGGFIVPTGEFVRGVAEICKKHEILLIADEVQSGFGRTGKWFGMENFGVVPDLTVMSKSLAAGLPLGAVTGRAEVMDAPKKKEIGTTLGGNPLACVAALKVIDMIEQQNLVQRARQIEEQVQASLNFPSRYIGEIRGMGAMFGIEFVKDPVTKEPDAEFTQAVVRGCYERGVMMVTAGGGHIIRLLPPLVISDEQLVEALCVLMDVIQKQEMKVACS